MQAIAGHTHLIISLVVHEYGGDGGGDLPSCRPRSERYSFVLNFFLFLELLPAVYDELDHLLSDTLWVFEVFEGK